MDYTVEGNACKLELTSHKYYLYTEHQQPIIFDPLPVQEIQIDILYIVRINIDQEHYTADYRTKLL